MLNVVALVGRLGQDPELKTTQTGVSVCSFSLAVDRGKSKDGTRMTDWIDCVAWRNTAEFISKYFTKGQMMSVEGSLQTRNWEKNGVKRKAVEVVVREAGFVGSRERVNVDTHKDQNQGNPPAEPDDFMELLDGDNDLPFD